MVISEQRDSVDIRIETDQPGTNRLLIHITPELAEGIAVAFEDAGGQVDRNVLEHSAPEVVKSVLEVAGAITASGAAVAAVLKEWWHRNDARKATVTFNDETLSLEGMSDEEMTQIIDKVHKQWDDRWRQQLSDHFPSEDDPAGDNKSE